MADESSEGLSQASRNEPPEPEGEPGRFRMPLAEHLIELRRRLIICLAVFMATFLLSFFLLYRYLPWFVTWPFKLASSRLNASGVQDVLLAPYELGPGESILVVAKLALILGGLVACPVILYEAWAFLRPGLTSRERRAVWPVLVAAPLCFLAGGAFGYFVMLPPVTLFFAKFSLAAGVRPWWSVGRTANYLLGMTAASGLVFELPVAVSILAALGIVTPRFLSRIRKYVVLVIFIVAAILTPPDPVSQILLAIPMLLLYEISILIARLIYRRRAREASHPD